ncbi:class F sortase [Isoptericola aurantiacus]|uniref:class F sortase n=1 Tax=Isoptericola aurantiacus TaxID=3377839 RepID=UPI00383BDF79
MTIDLTTTWRRAARRRAVPAAAAGIVGVALALGGCGTGPAGDPQAASSPQPAAAGGVADSADTAPSDTAPSDTAPSDAAPPSAAGPSGSRGAGAQRARAVPDVPVRPATDAVATTKPPAPVRVRVGALGIDVPVRPTGAGPDGTMALPDSADEAGWYRFGPAPGSENGATVVAAHVDDADSVGPFARLTDARQGDELTVDTADGTTYNYTVTDVRSVEKARTPLAEIFDRSGAPRLVLVTCGGRWDAEVGSYTDNVVVTADPAD